MRFALNVLNEAVQVACDLVNGALTGQMAPLYRQHLYETLREGFVIMRFYKTSAITLAGLLMFYMSPSMAAKYWTSLFQINNIFVSAEGNAHFRVGGLPPAANCPGNWAYLNQADSGSREYFSVLTAAYMANKNAQLFVEPDPATGWCHIYEANVQ